MLQGISEWVVKVKNSMTDVLASFSFEGEQEEEASGEEELEIDDTLPVLEKIKHYIQSEQILHRLYLVRELAEYSRLLGYADTREHLLPLLSEIQRDTEPVIRQALVEQIPHIANYLKQNAKNGVAEEVFTVLLPLAAQLAKDQNPQVRASSTESLILLAQDMTQELLSQYMFPVITALANDASQEEHRVEAAQLLNHVATLISSELCIEYVVPLLLRLATDSFRVRKAVASYLGSICLNQKTNKEELASKLLPLYLEMYKDDIWGVRKACAESLVPFSQVVSAEQRLNLLVPVFENLVQDTSRWVRSAANQSLGRFIATFDPSQVPPSLLQYYTAMAKANPTSKHVDAENMTYCAFDFPAVIFTIGGDRWDEVKDTFLVLVKDYQWKVRRPLSHSLHEIARIVGTDITERDLLPVFEVFLRDINEVKVGVVRHVAEFLQLLSPTSRSKYLPIICEITNEDDSNWRFRRLIAKQLGALSQLYSPELVHEHLAPISLQMCQDNVADVRKASNSSVGPLIQRLSESTNKDLQKEYLDQILAFATETSFVDRQLFVNICGRLVGHSPTIGVFRDKFLPRLLTLAEDKVANVRLAVSQVLFDISANYPQICDEQVSQVLEKLAHDKDRDVAYFAGGAVVEKGKAVEQKRTTTREQEQEKEKEEGTTSASVLATFTEEKEQDTSALMGDEGQVEAEATSPSSSLVQLQEQGSHQQLEEQLGEDNNKSTTG
ncbi:Serine/threonine-protein phosphatase 4 regulatory subunit 1 [Balamuthia mandrillaris]